MTAICDTGPLVAYLNRRDPYHVWAVAVMKQVRPPMLTCEPVLTEAVYFLREDGLAVDPLFRMLERGALRLEFDVSAHWPRLRTLMARIFRTEGKSRSWNWDEDTLPTVGAYASPISVAHV